MPETYVWFKSVQVGEEFHQNSYLSHVPQRLKKISQSEAIWFSDLPNLGNTETVQFNPRCLVIVDRPSSRSTPKAQTKKKQTDQQPKAERGTRLITMRGRQPVGHRNNWNFKLEAGDKVVDHEGTVWRLEESTGRWKRAAGELTPRRVKPPVPGAIAVLHQKRWCWQIGAPIRKPAD